MKRAKEFLKNLFLNRWKAKVGSLLIATLFYFYVLYTKNITKTFYLKVEPPNLPVGLVFSEEPPTFVKVTFSGPQELMDIDRNSFSLYMINPGPGPGKNKFRLELYPPLPANLQANIEPAEVELLLDVKKKKYLPIVPKVEIPLNKKILYWNISPNSIEVEGPEKIINKTDRVYLSKIKLNENNTFFYDKISIGELPKFIKISENQPFEIQVEIRYASEEELKTKIEKLSSEYHFFEEELKLQCSNILDKLELKEVKVKVFYISKYYLTKDSMTAETFCPVEWNPVLEIIEPGDFIPNLPIVIRTRSEFKEFEIIKMEPLSSDLNFTLRKKVLINQLERGLKEHLIQ
ncbi:MAG: hypothetical protein NZ853_05350 [Leptospiraceae bacterium]|nr:hypothetical protein [Leptospiraceae bacterium]MDW7976626.1 hypothetical protein [Leptospiraceae bacterium]